MRSSTKVNSASFDPTVKHPRLPDDIFRYLIQSCPKSVQRLFMPLNHRLYDIATPILYRDVTLEPNRRRTILDGLRIDKQVPSPSSRDMQSPKNRKQVALKSVQVLRLNYHTHDWGISLLADAGRLEYTLPNVCVLHMVGDLCGACKEFYACSLITSRDMKPKKLVMYMSEIQAFSDLSIQLDACESAPLQLTILVDMLLHVNSRYIQSDMDHRSKRLASTPIIVILQPQGRYWNDAEMVVDILASIISYLTPATLNFVGAERLTIKGDDGKDRIEEPGKGGHHTVPWQNSYIYRKLQSRCLRSNVSANPLLIELAQEPKPKRQMSKIRWITMENVIMARHLTIRIDRNLLKGGFEISCQLLISSAYIAVMTLCPTLLLSTGETAI